MNKCIILCGLILLLLANSQVFGAENTLGKKIYPGMTMTEFNKVCPKVKTDSGNKQYPMKETLHGLDGKWTYEFRDNKLSWYLYNYYIQEYDQLNEKNFNKCLKATEKIIADLTKIYGKPTRFEEGTKVFKDPAKKRHWGYDVIEAEWKTDKSVIEAKFKFFGGKGEYFFVVSVQFSPNK